MGSHDITSASAHIAPFHEGHIHRSRLCTAGHEKNLVSAQHLAPLTSCSISCRDSRTRVTGPRGRAARAQRCSFPTPSRPPSAFGAQKCLFLRGNRRPDRHIQSRGHRGRADPDFFEITRTYPLSSALSAPLYHQLLSDASGNRHGTPWRNVAHTRPPLGALMHSRSAWEVVRSLSHRLPRARCRRCSPRHGFRPSALTEMLAQPQES